MRIAVLQVACVGLLVWAATPEFVQAQEAAAWTFRDDGGPTPRDYHTMAYDINRGVVVLFGGHDGGSYLGDTWEWNGETWRLAHPGDPNGVEAPLPRLAHSMAYNSSEGVVVLFGGQDASNVLRDTWTWDGQEWKNVTPPEGAPNPPPAARYEMVYDSHREKIVLIVCYVNIPDDLLWEGSLNPNTGKYSWTDLPDLLPRPSARYHVAVAYDSMPGVIVLFGGIAPPIPFDDTWEAHWDEDVGTYIWEEQCTEDEPCPCQPPANASAIMAYDSRRDKCVLFGGTDTSSPFGNTWEWDGTWTNPCNPDDPCDPVILCDPSPSPRYTFDMAFDSARSVVVLNGGSVGGTEYPGDTWEYGCEVVVSLDIKPGSFPNPVNRGSHGVLPVAVVGSAEFDVTMIDVLSVRLSRADGVGGEVAPNEGPPGPHSTFEDVATPFEGEACDCYGAAGDGIDDLSLKFRTGDVVAALLLSTFEPGDEVELIVTGVLLDGSAFSTAGDCIRIVPSRTTSVRAKAGQASGRPGQFVGRPMTGGQRP